MELSKKSSIGIFDSGYGGLTILHKIRTLLPELDYIYLGDNARSPYGTRSYEVVYDFTLQAVKWLFSQGCRLVIIACNTASAKALRTIQQKDLPEIDPERRVLGVIRPTVESIGKITRSGHVGVLGTPGTIASNSYPLEIQKLFPDIEVTGESCPMWVPLVENGEHNKPGADYFIRQNLDSILKKDPQIDALILGCTHYPLLIEKIEKHLPENVTVIAQGDLVAQSLQDYLFRHPEMKIHCSETGTCTYYTTESEGKFSEMASLFLAENIHCKRICLE